MENKDFAEMTPEEVGKAYEDAAAEAGREVEDAFAQAQAEAEKAVAEAQAAANDFQESVEKAVNTYEEAPEAFEIPSVEAVEAAAQDLEAAADEAMGIEPEDKTIGAVPEGPVVEAWDASPVNQTEQWQKEHYGDAGKRVKEEAPEPVFEQPAEPAFKQPEAPAFEQPQYQQPQFEQPPYQQPPYQQQFQPGYVPEIAPAHNLALASLILGIAALVLCLTGAGAFLSLICGIIGAVLGSKAKAQGNTETICKAGFITSIIGIVLGAIVIIGCVACIGLAGLGSAMSY